MFGGFSHKRGDMMALSSTQSVGLDSDFIAENLQYSCFASAVTLSEGVLLTGGKNNGRKVMFLIEPSLISVRKQNMIHGRYGHSSVKLHVDGDEHVVVAGGFQLQRREVQASVELYNVRRDQWVELEDLPSPRVYFSLQVF